LWVSDGTNEGTFMVKDIRPGELNSGISKLIVMNDWLLFDATNGIDGRELWRTDGTEANTSMVIDIYAGEEASNPLQFTIGFNKLFFSADNGVNGLELWSTEGEIENTTMVKDINQTISDGGGSGTSFLTMALSSLFLKASDGIHGSELWVSNGTTEGTVSIKPAGSTAMGPLDDHYGGMYSIEDTLFLFANYNGQDNELWKVTPASPSAVDKNSFEAGIIVYPNPGNGLMNITSAARNIVGVEVFDACGNIVYAKASTPLSNLFVDTTKWSPGAYAVMIKNDHHSITVITYLKQ
jgi:ELWxxDGT repeat protein